VEREKVRIGPRQVSSCRKWLTSHPAFLIFFGCLRDKSGSNQALGVLVARIMLRKMKKGQSGTVTAVKVAGELGRRIREMGLVPGTRVTIQGRAPLYDPVALKIMGGTLTLRNNEADYIELELDETGE